MLPEQRQTVQVASPPMSSPESKEEGVPVSDLKVRKPSSIRWKHAGPVRYPQNQVIAAEQESSHTLSLYDA